MVSSTDRLFRNTARRQWLAALGLCTHRLTLLLALVFGVWLLASRLLGVLPDWLAPASVAAIPLVAALLAGLLQRRPAARDTARRIDARAGTKDLFLTRVLIDRAEGDYQNLVVRDAEEQAAGLRASSMVPLDGWRRAGSAAGALVLVLAGTLFLPRFDPFGRQTRGQTLAALDQTLRAQKRETRERVEVLLARGSSEENSPEVEQALDQLRASLQRMQAARPKQNLRPLDEQQKIVGAMWRKASDQNLKRSAAPRQTQQLGRGPSRQAQQWKQELEQGSTDGIRNEMRELRDLAEKLARSKDSLQRQELGSELERRMRELSDSLQGESGSPELNLALSRMLQQMQLADASGLSSQALDALAQSSELVELELEALAQSLRDLEALEEALRTLQLAKQLNADELLDGEACKDARSMAEYREVYEAMLRERGLAAGRCGQCQGGGCSACGGTGQVAMGSGTGMGGPGTGRGGIAPEDPTASTEFKTEKSRAALTAGRILLQLETREVAQHGQARVDYAESLQQVRQGVGEAILQEQVPPGYHDAIQKYFDSLTEKSGR